MNVVLPFSWWWIMRVVVFLLVLMGLCCELTAQAGADFSVWLEPFSIPQAPGVHAYAYGRHQGRWLIVGGRRDGLHRRDPWGAFPASANNRDLLLVDPQSLEVWQADVGVLPTAVSEQLQSSSMNFCQLGDYLVIVGGYGYSASANNHITFPRLTVIDVPGLAAAIEQGLPLAPHVRSVSDGYFAVVGGQLGYLNGYWYLAAGNRFDGRYNSTTSATYTQQYTNAVRRFKLDLSTLEVSDTLSWVDAVNLHRRDYNMVGQVFPDGTEGFTIFSGVFQYLQDLPYLNSVDLTAAGPVVNNDFEQFLNHYHCPKVGIYSQAEGVMHSVFFGGISQYEPDSQGGVVQNDSVPFVRTVGRVTRWADGSMTEMRLPIEMPGYLGTGAEFIPAPDLPTYSHGVVKLDELPQGPVLLGYVYGGISSQYSNVFGANDDSFSGASEVAFRVYVQRGASGGRTIRSKGQAKLVAAPNPAVQRTRLCMELPQSGRVYLTVQGVDGRILRTLSLGYQAAGCLDTELDLSGYPSGVLFLTLHAGQSGCTIRLVRQLP